MHNTLEPLIMAKLSKQIKEYEELGGVLEFQVLKVNGYTKHLHKFAAMYGIQLIALKHTNELYYLNKEKEELPYHVLVNYSVNLQKMKGKEISLEKFLGPHFHFDKKEIILRGSKNKDFLNQYFLGLSTEKQDNVIHIDNIGNGYCYAFAEPPYNMRSKAKTYHVFWNIDKLLFNIFVDELEIYEWSNDWSNFFEQEKEWWGTFYWTIFNKTKNIMIVIAGSSSD